MVHGLKQHHVKEDVKGDGWAVLGLGGIWSWWWWRTSGPWRGGCGGWEARHGRGGSSPRWTQTRGPGSLRRAGFSEQGSVESNVLEVEGKPSRSWNSELEHCLFVIDYIQKKYVQCFRLWMSRMLGDSKSSDVSPRKNSILWEINFSWCCLLQV